MALEVSPRELAKQLTRLGIVRVCGILGRGKPAKVMALPLALNRRKPSAIPAVNADTFESMATVGASATVSPVLRDGGKPHVGASTVQTISVFVIDAKAGINTKDESVQVNLSPFLPSTLGSVCVPAPSAPSGSPLESKHTFGIGCVDQRNLVFSQLDSDGAIVGMRHSLASNTGRGIRRGPERSNAAGPFAVSILPQKECCEWH